MPALQDARAIADAVLKCSRRRHADSTKDAPTQAVLRTMEKRGLWFMVDDADAAAKAWNCDRPWAAMRPVDKP